MEKKPPMRWLRDIPEDWYGRAKSRVFGEWHHICYPCDLSGAISSKGEICVTSRAAPIFSDAENGDEDVKVLVLYRGEASFWFPEDCYSVPRKNGERMATHSGPSGSWDEAWITPARSKVMAVYVSRDLLVTKRERGAIYEMVRAIGAVCYDRRADFMAHTYRPPTRGRIGTLADIWPGK